MSKRYCGHIYAEKSCGFCRAPIATKKSADWGDNDTLEIAIPEEFQLWKDADTHKDCVDRSSHEALQERYMWAKDALHRSRVVGSEIWDAILNNAFVDYATVEQKTRKLLEIIDQALIDVSEVH